MLYLIIAVVAIIGCFIFMSNNLAGKKNRVEQSLSNIDVYLEKRFDEMSSLLEQLMVGYQHEDKIYTAISKARSGIVDSSNPNERVAAMNGVTSMLAMPGLRAEAYPELQTLRGLASFSMNATSANERDILGARKAYNSNVTSYNNALDMFPTSIIAKSKGYTKEYELLKVADYKRETPSVLGIRQQAQQMNMAAVRQAPQTTPTEAQQETQNM